MGFLSWFKETTVPSNVALKRCINLDLYSVSGWMGISTSVLMSRSPMSLLLRVCVCVCVSVDCVDSIRAVGAACSVRELQKAWRWRSILIIFSPSLSLRWICKKHRHINVALFTGKLVCQSCTRMIHLVTFVFLTFRLDGHCDLRDLCFWFLG